MRRRKRTKPILPGFTYIYSWSLVSRDSDLRFSYMGTRSLATLINGLCSLCLFSKRASIKQIKRASGIKHPGIHASRYTRTPQSSHHAQLWPVRPSIGLHHHHMDSRSIDLLRTCMLRRQSRRRIHAPHVKPKRPSQK